MPSATVREFDAPQAGRRGRARLDVFFKLSYSARRRGEAAPKRPRGRPEAYPKGRPHPQDPKNPLRTPRAAPVPPLATLRHGAARAAGGLPKGAKGRPLPRQVTQRPLR